MTWNIYVQICLSYCIAIQPNLIVDSPINVQNTAIRTIHLNGPNVGIRARLP
ncbi:Profilin conserved site [Trema orientale]|uniref:Profilin conserved site n=1 Tax=Trema orientale TaxID=63057 RepID=A0A2P5E9V4_TREOI|nr:Profilin conserved site [Trema orientale]